MQELRFVALFWPSKYGLATPYVSLALLSSYHVYVVAPTIDTWQGGRRFSLNWQNLALPKTLDLIGAIFFLTFRSDLWGIK